MPKERLLGKKLPGKLNIFALNKT